MFKKCPLCQGKLVNGECISCGYKPPDEGDISALYNYDPSDYPQEEPKMREIAPDPFMEEIYPDRQNAPKFKVRDDEGKTVRSDRNAADQYANTPPKQEYKSPNPYANDGTFKPYQSAQNNGEKPNFQNPYANNGNFKPYTGNTSNDDFGAFLKQYWWLLLLAFLIPVVGLVMFFSMKDSISPKYRWVLIAAAVLGFILPP